MLAPLPQGLSVTELFRGTLELAANITSLLETEIDGIGEEMSEAIGLLLAERREVLAKACKGKPELLLEAMDTASEDNVTPLTAQA
ncbi:MAG: YebG family protein [Cellvibrionaceae bacterium]|nr:YebG family protein [Cellvibrionaceae bacterium]MCV6624887.1 YebG family protein [Cellvibrionaceae bacterium]